MRTCSACLGAVFQPGEVIAYAGQLCVCGSNTPVFDYNNQVKLTSLSLKIVELEAELKLVRGQRNSSNREIERLRDQLGLEPYKPCTPVFLSSACCSRGTKSCNDTHED